MAVMRFSLRLSFSRLKFLSELSDFFSSAFYFGMRKDTILRNALRRVKYLRASFGMKSSSNSAEVVAY
jgi:hypothetical protein